MSWITRIDKLTHSIEEATTGKSFDTEVFEVKKADLATITPANRWHFNWHKELNTLGRAVYKLVVKGDEQIQCLISMEDKSTFLYLPLIETAPHNLGKHKQYIGAPGNLTAFACKRSFEHGYDGVVAFDAKTKLMPHYQTSLGATHLGGSKMAIYTREAQNLVSLYFKDFTLHEKSHH